MAANLEHARPRVHLRQMQRRRAVLLHTHLDEGVQGARVRARGRARARVGVSGRARIRARVRAKARAKARARARVP